MTNTGTGEGTGTMSYVTEIDHSASKLSAARYLANHKAKDIDSAKKFIAHVLLILMGVAIAVGLTFIPTVGWFAIPLGQIPSIIIEWVDMKHGW